MYYNDYEDYMRTVLGYNNVNANMNNMCNMYNQDIYMQNRMPCQMNNTYPNDCMSNMAVDNIEDLYPDIYKIVNPLVCRVCQNNNRPITNDVIEQMISEVYSNIKADDINIVNINVETGDVINRETTNRTSENREARVTKEKADVRSIDENRNRRPNNPLLRDLIRILLLNRLFGNQRPGQRPPVRPPFPGPIMPGPRPPMPPMRPRYDQTFETENMQEFPQMYGYGNYYNY